MSYNKDNLSEEQKLQTFNKWDLIYRKLKTCNEQLLEKNNQSVEDNENLIEDSFLFYVSSFGLSLMKNLYLHLDDSLGNIVNVRCILEGIGILEYINKFENKDELYILLRAQSYILERNMYKKYSSFDKRLFDFDLIQSNYETYKQTYKSIKDLNTKKFQYVCRKWLKRAYLSDKMSTFNSVGSIRITY